ncbi:hypothetical protein N7533_011029 [Penicillium manginii]|uniref:uncharacterized protein n=1 Tax=Penicillium manginii TaxID=203109 RepID=UPI0025492725|nr:uncharacterized protein N7533_011029 [Penicillium manginii]KAJ5741620.1 hypothetical protein N7533_011029 [Penicillium manginii]
MPENNYDVGDRVQFQEISYECIQAHRSQVDWEPRSTPDLWKAIGAIEPELPEVDFPLYRKRALLLPLELDLKSILATSTEEKNEEIDNQKVAANEAEIEAQALLAKHEDLRFAVSELVKMSPDHLQVTIPPDHDGADVDPKFTRNTVLGDQLEYRSSLRKVALTRSDSSTKTAGAGHTSGISGSLADEPTPTPTPVQTEPTGAFTLAKDLLSSTGVLGPLGQWKHVPADARTPRLKKDALSELSERTRKVLSVYDIDPSKQPINCWPHYPYRALAIE